MDFDEAFPELYRLAYRVARTVLDAHEEAEDVAQDTLARALRRWGSVGSTAEGWVATVSANRAIDIARGRQRRLRSAWLVRASGGRDAPEAEAGVVDRLDLEQALMTLSRRQRDVVVLRYLVGLPEADVAAALGCSVGSVKTHASRALRSLRVSGLEGTP